jgi:hypothetical protein
MKRESAFFGKSGSRGADFVAAGVDVKDILENLFSRKRGALRRFFGSCADSAD